MSRHVVLIHRYFLPDTPPYAAILGDLATHLGNRGFRVTVLTCQPSYNRDVVRGALAREQWSHNVSVVRWPVVDDRTSGPRKVANLVWFCLRLCLAMPRLGKVDVMMAASTPPVVLAATAALLAKTKGAAFVYHRQDIYPEVTIGLGRRVLGPLGRLLRMVDSRTDRSADRVVVLSEDMAQTIAERGVKPERIVEINNFDPWHIAEESAAPREQSPAEERELDVVFAGNLGRFQGLEVLLEALTALQDAPIRFHFFGTGALVDDLAARVAEQRLRKVEVYGYRPPDEVADFLARRADLGVVSLAAGVIRAAYPSKTLSYLRQGTPILALVEGDSELARTVREERLGVQVDPADLAGLVSTLRTLALDPSTLVGAAERAKEVYNRRFSRTVRLEQWTALFEELAS